MFPQRYKLRVSYALCAAFVVGSYLDYRREHASDDQFARAKLKELARSALEHKLGVVDSMTVCELLRSTDPPEEFKKIPSTYCMARVSSPLPPLR